ncbi:zinc finger protein zat5 [Quercus suber]|uniref:Zinc finger protein zat5 n=1 Tax=Quercus suber TaxID=58331 RepID=A0AAW0L1M4_QUESU
MEAQEEVMMGSRDQTHIVKGKRTKRQRPQSPIPFAMITTTSGDDIIGGGGGGGSGGGGTTTGGDCYNVDILNTNNIINWSPPATTSTELQDSTEEEEDMANCLILLAKGQSVRGRALGGHRASHKKTKALAAAAEEKKQFLLSSEDDSVEEAQQQQQQQQQVIIKKNNNDHFSSSLSLQLSNSSRGLYSNNNNINRSNNNNNNNKVHECSVCGAEFTSGQALGGHMRRHRSPMGTSSSTMGGNVINTLREREREKTMGVWLGMSPLTTTTKSVV